MDNPLETFTISFDLTIQKPMSEYSRTLSQHELFVLVKDQIKASFDTEICKTGSYKINRKIVNEQTERLDKEGVVY